MKSLQVTSNFESNQGIMGSMIPQENQLVVRFFFLLMFVSIEKRLKREFKEE
jgi:hypothetical protein